MLTLGSATTVGVTVRMIVAEPPGAIGPGCVQVTTWPTAPQVKPPPEAPLKVSPGARVSVTVIAPVVAALPRFCTSRVKVPAFPIANVPDAVLVIARSGTPMTGVATTRTVSLVAFWSPGVLARPRLFTVGSALALTATVSAIVAAALGASAGAAGRVQVTSGGALAQLKPPPEADTKLSPVESESTTVMTPVVGEPPTLLTVRPYVAFAPTLNGLVAAFASCTSKALTTGMAAVVATLLAAVGSSGVLTRARLLTLGVAAASTLTVSATTTESPTATGVPAARKQLTAWPVAAQLKPPPTPLTKVRPVASVSSRRIESVAAADPTFFAIRLNTAVDPIVNCAVVATLASCRSGTAIVIVRSLDELLDGVLSPPPETRATLV